MINVLERITQYRIQKKWTEAQLASASGLTQSTISSWYRKEVLPTIPSLEKICDAFGISLAQFFLMEEEDSLSCSVLKCEILSELERLSEEQQNALLTFIKTL